LLIIRSTNLGTYQPTGKYVTTTDTYSIKDNENYCLDTGSVNNNCGATGLIGLNARRKYTFTPLDI